MPAFSGYTVILTITTRERGEDLSAVPGHGDGGILLGRVSSVGVVVVGEDPDALQLVGLGVLLIGQENRVNINRMQYLLVRYGEPWRRSTASRSTGPALADREHCFCSVA